MPECLLISGRTPGPGHRRGALVVTALLAALAAGCLPLGHVQLARHSGFMPALGAASLLVDGLTAGLLLAQAHMARNRPALRLGAAYLFSALIAIPYLLAFRSLVAAEPTVGSGASAIWLWCAWHAGFPLLVIGFAFGGAEPLRPADLPWTVSAIALAVAALTVAATAGLPWLPPVLDGGSYSRLAGTGVGPAILLLTSGSALVVLRRLRCRNVLSLWLNVALLAATLDVALTLVGTGQFTVGWYSARMLSLFTGICVLFALLSELMREAGRVAETNTRLEQLLQTDVLTGLANRRAFEAAVDAEWRRAQREQTALSLLMVDIDCFKAFNDCYGHPAGDHCLRAVAEALASQAYRPADIAARIGGEEFAVLLPVTEESGALQVAERVRASVMTLQVPHSGNDSGVVTVSVGAATLRPFAPAGDASQLVNGADAALYRAKAAGRNAVRGCEVSALVLI